MYNRYWTKSGNLQKVANYIDDALDSQMQKGRAETDPAKRKAIFAEFEKHLAEVSPWIWLYTSYSYTAQQKNIQGFVPTPTGTLFSLSKVTIQQ
jgi:peptide/nickel transport system substrate-binding protein